MDDQRIHLVIEAQNKADKAFTEVRKGLEGVSDKVEDAQKRVSGLGARLEGMQPAFQKMALFGGAAAAAVTYGLSKALNSAVDLGESVNAVQVVFGDASERIFEFGNTAATAAGLAKSEFNSMATLTGALLKDTGLSMNEVADTTVDLTKRAADLASVFNTDVGDAMAAINAAVRGETEAIRRYAADVTDASLQQYALANGISTSVSKMSEQEKRLLRVKVIMAQTAVATGDFVNTSDSLANRQRILDAQLKNVSSTLGAALIPAMTEILNTIAPIITKVSTWIEENPKLAATLGVIFVALTGLVAVVGVLGIALAGLTAGATALGIGLGVMLGALVLVPIAIAAIVAAGVLLYKNWESISSFAEGIWGQIVDTITGALDAVASVFTQTWEGIKTAFTTYIYFLVGLVAMLFDLILPGWQEKLGMLLAAWNGAWDAIQGMLVKAGEGLKTTFLNLGSFFQGFWEGVVAIFMWAKDQIAGVIAWINDAVEPIFSLIDKLKNALDGIGKSVSSALSKVVDKGKSVVGARAYGGPVSAGLPYVVGERGPEVFTPSTAGRISTRSGGGNININVTGGTFVDMDDFVGVIGKKLMDELRLNTRLAM